MRKSEITLYWKADDRSHKATATVEHDGQLTPAVIKAYAGGTTRTFARSNWSSDYHAVTVARARYVRGSEREL